MEPHVAPFYIENPLALLLTILKHKSLDYLRIQISREEAFKAMAEWKQRELSIRMSTLEGCNHWSDFPVKFKSYPEVLAENGYMVGATGKGWDPGFANDSLGNPRNLVGEMWNQIKLTPPTKGISNIDYAANFKEFLKNKPEGKLKQKY